ncbi:hypothetical protein KIL84_013212 [Mauremys mutica]|uniref:Uncharacterized protein n=1 Tax=Mauremys mutica TaxID=74926 RepID=A0A9D3WV46_9SAUR|nr:hypothetical protein KIL84_013212 [Mauremys mutica]
MHFKKRMVNLSLNTPNQRLDETQAIWRLNFNFKTSQIAQENYEAVNLKSEAYENGRQVFLGIRAKALELITRGDKNDCKFHCLQN